MNREGTEIIAIQEVAADDDLQEVFGIAFNPLDTSRPTPVYVSDTVSGFGNDGPAPEGAFPGKITRISGDDYQDLAHIITGLPTSNSSHQTESIGFLSDGGLIILQGSTTNAGVPNPPGSLFFRYPDVPLSGAILIAYPAGPGFDGNVRYAPEGVYATDVDQVAGGVSVYAAGFRNPYDFVIHSNGKMYATDNGPDPGQPGFPSGPASTSCTTDSGMNADGPDELNIIVPGAYYGHANRNRGRYDPRQCVYHLALDAETADHVGPIATIPSSSNGITEYTSDAFGGALRGDLIYVSIPGDVHRIELSDDGSSVISDSVLTSGLKVPLDVVTRSDGTIWVAEYGGDQITVLSPRIEGD